MLNITTSFKGSRVSVIKANGNTIELALLFLS